VLSLLPGHCVSESSVLYSTVEYNTDRQTVLYSTVGGAPVVHLLSMRRGSLPGHTQAGPSLDVHARRSVRALDAQAGVCRNTQQEAHNGEHSST